MAAAPTEFVLPETTETPETLNVPLFTNTPPPCALVELPEMTLLASVNVPALMYTPPPP